MYAFMPLTVGEVVHFGVHFSDLENGNNYPKSKINVDC